VRLVPSPLELGPASAWAFGHRQYQIGHLYLPKLYAQALAAIALRLSAWGVIWALASSVGGRGGRLFGHARAPGLRAELGDRLDYYLVDETPAVGDAQFQKKCQQTFREKLSTSRIIMVSHQFATLRKYCDIDGVLRDGELTLYPTLTDAIRVHSGEPAEDADADLEAIEG
jgi:ABC-type transport system involved in cytochrome bd biosynthesis fused ATPase/permease subunit